MEALKVGKQVILRRSNSPFEEPYSVPGSIETVIPNVKLTDRIMGRQPVDVVVATESLSRVMLKRIHPGNLSLAFDPCFLP